MSHTIDAPRRKYVRGVTERPPGRCAWLGALTLGLYSFYWFYITAKEMDDEGVKVPSGWLMVVPGVNLWWFWCWCSAVGRYTRGYLGAGTALMYLLLVPGSQIVGIVTVPQGGSAVAVAYAIIGLLSFTCVSIPILQYSLNRFRKVHLLDAFE